MDKETITILTEYDVAGQQIELTVRHDEVYEYSFQLKVGCVDEHLTIDELKRLRNLFNAGLRTFAKVTK